MLPFFLSGGCWGLCWHKSKFLWQRIPSHHPGRGVWPGSTELLVSPQGLVQPGRGDGSLLALVTSWRMGGSGGRLAVVTNLATC